jgi:hypothetical protein
LFNDLHTVQITDDCLDLWENRLDSFDMPCIADKGDNLQFRVFPSQVRHGLAANIPRDSCSVADQYTQVIVVRW